MLLLHSDERLLQIPDPGWLERSCTFSIRNAINCVEHSGFDTSGIVVQKLVSKHIAEQSIPFDVSPFLTRRLNRFIPENDCDTGHILCTLRETGKRFKPCIVSAAVVTFLNGWCTRARFGLVDEGCIFCNSGILGDINHLIVCPCLQNAILGSLNQNHIFVTLEKVMACKSNGRTFGVEASDFYALYRYLAFRAFNAVRHGDKLNCRLITHICKRLAFHCSHSRKTIKHLRQNRIGGW